MAFGIFARGLEYQRTGVGNYLNGLLWGLSSLDKAKENCIIFCSPDTRAFAHSHAHEIPIKAFKPNPKGHFSRIAWDHLIAPFFAYRYKLQSILAPLHIRPLISTCPTAVVVHDMMYHTNPEFWPLSQRLYFQTLFSASTLRADRILVPSYYTQATLRSLFPKLESKIVVIPYGIDSTIFYASKNKQRETSEPYLLYAGGFHPRKNVPLLIEVFERIHRHFPVRLKLVGVSGWNQKQVRERIEASPAKAAIDLLIDVEQGYLRNLMSNALIFLFPSSNEGFGFPVLEAMACGTPVISSNRGSLPEIVLGGGILTEPEADPFESAIITLLDDPKLRETLSLKALSTAAQFSWKQCAIKTFEILKVIT